MDVVLFTDVCSPGFGRYAGTYRIATELRNAGFSVQVVEYFTRWTTDELKKIIFRFVSKDTLLVGISTTFLLNEISRSRAATAEIRQKYRDSKDEGHRLAEFLGRTDWPELYETIKYYNRKTQVSVGGHKVGQFSLGPYLDYAIVGEGEASMVALLQGLDDGSRLSGNYLHKKYDGFTTSTIRLEDNDLIFPQEQLPVEIARGCIFKCKFCSFHLNGKKLWEFNRKPELVTDELQYANDKYGSTGFMFCDDTYNDSVEKVRTYHDQFKKLSFDQTFSAYARADLIISHPETIDMLYESGLRSVNFGIETLNHKSGKAIGKGMHPEKLKEGLYRIKERWPDVLITAGLIVGLPHDTPETLRKNNEWFEQKDCPVQYPSYYPLHINTNKGDKDDKSTIENNPFSFGYQTTDDGYWKSEWMDKVEAEQLVEEFDRPGNVVSWVFFNRMQNIGYTPSDLIHNRVTEEDIIQRENNLMNTYKERLWQI